MPSLFRHIQSLSTTTSPLSAVLHHRHTLTSPSSSNTSVGGICTASVLPVNSTHTPQNVTGIANTTIIINMTMEDAGGGLKGTSSLNAAPAPAVFERGRNEDYGPQINFTIWLFTALSAMFLALRVYCKFLRHRGLWWDDHILIASWVSPTAAV